MEGGRNHNFSEAYAKYDSVYSNMSAFKRWKFYLLEHSDMHRATSTSSVRGVGFYSLMFKPESFEYIGTREQMKIAPF